MTRRNRNRGGKDARQAMLAAVSGVGVVPELTPSMIYGIANVRSNIVFVGEHRIAHPIGGVVVIDDLKSKTQRFLNITQHQKKNEIDSIAVSRDGKYIAVGEKGQRPRISIFSTDTCDRLRLLGVPLDTLSAEELLGLQFTCCGEFIIAITGPPDFRLVQYEWKKGKILFNDFICPEINPAPPIEGLAVHPTDPEQLALAGWGVYKKMNNVEGIWKQVGNFKLEALTMISICWLNARQVAVGTADCRIIVFEGTEIREILQADLMNEFSFVPLTQDERRASIVPLSLDAKKEFDPDLGVKNLTAFHRGFAYNYTYSQISVFEEISPFKYKKANVFDVSTCIRWTQLWSGRCNKIVSISFSPSGNQIAVSTTLNEIYLGDNFQFQDFEKTPLIKLSYMDQGFHQGPITHMSCAKWKPLLLTLSSADMTIRFWNYDNKKLVMYSELGKEVHSAALHPTGLLCILSFHDEIQLNLILWNGMEKFSEIGWGSSPFVAFSNHGHQFGCVYHDNKSIYVYTTIDVNLKFILKGHLGPIPVIKWVPSDDYMWSVGGDGYIYQWDCHDGKRSANVFIDTHHVDVTSVNDKLAYITSSDGKIREITDGKVTRTIDIDHDVLICAEIGRYAPVLIAAGDRNTVIAIQYPLQERLCYSEVFFHSKPVDLLRLTQDNRVLVSVSQAENSLCFWDVWWEGATSVRTGYLEMMLMPVGDVEKRLFAVKTVEHRYKHLKKESAVQWRQWHQRVQDDRSRIIRWRRRLYEDKHAILEQISFDMNEEQDKLKFQFNKDRAVVLKQFEKQERLLAQNMIREIDDCNSLMEEIEQRIEERNQLEMGYIKSLENIKNHSESEVNQIFSRCKMFLHMLKIRSESDEYRDSQLKKLLEKDHDLEVNLIGKESNQTHDESKYLVLVLKVRKIKIRQAMQRLKRKFNYLDFIYDGLEQDYVKLHSVMVAERDKVQESEQLLRYKLKKVKELVEEIEKAKAVEKMSIKDTSVTFYESEAVRQKIEPLQNEVHEMGEENYKMNFVIINLSKRLTAHLDMVEKLKYKIQEAKNDNKALKKWCHVFSAEYKTLRDDYFRITRYNNDVSKLINAFREMVNKHVNKKKMKEIVEMINYKWKLQHPPNIIALMKAKPQWLLSTRRKSQKKTPILNLSKENNRLTNLVIKLKHANEKLISDLSPHENLLSNKEQMMIKEYMEYKEITCMGKNDDENDSCSFYSLSNLSDDDLSLKELNVQPLGETPQDNFLNALKVEMDAILSKYDSLMKSPTGPKPDDFSMGSYLDVVKDPYFDKENYSIVKCNVCGHEFPVREEFIE